MLLESVGQLKVNLNVRLQRLKDGSPGIISLCEVVFCFSGLDTTTNTILTPNLRSGLGAYSRIYDVGHSNIMLVI